jgi:hypothetical protein
MAADYMQIELKRSCVAGLSMSTVVEKCHG